MPAASAGAAAVHAGNPGALGERFGLGLRGFRFQTQRAATHFAEGHQLAHDFLARLDGMAKPRPMLPAALPRGLKLAMLMPTSSPFRLTSAPPELPGLIEASVWMKFW